MSTDTTFALILCQKRQKPETMGKKVILTNKRLEYE